MASYVNFLTVLFHVLYLTEVGPESSNKQRLQTEDQNYKT